MATFFSGVREGAQRCWLGVLGRARGQGVALLRCSEEKRMERFVKRFWNVVFWRLDEHEHDTVEKHRPACW